MAFYFRSNDAGGGSFYFRSSEIRSNQTITGADIVLDWRSVFFNLPVVPVDGDQVTMPTIFQGSTITLQNNGFYEINPPLPAGTLVPRDFFDVSGNQTYSDYLEIYDTQADPFVISGSGDMSISGAASESSLGSVYIDSLGDVVATGAAVESAQGTVTVSGTGDLSITGTASGISSGDVIISSFGEIMASGSITVDPSLAGDVAISGEGFLFVSGIGGNAPYSVPINRVFRFD